MPTKSSRPTRWQWLSIAILAVALAILVCTPSSFGEPKSPPKGKAPAPDKPAPKKPARAPVQVAKAPDKSPPTCAVQDRFFQNDVWAKVGERVCLKCHRAGGDAGESEFILAPAPPHDGMDPNCEAFGRMARAKEGDQSRLLLKVVGGLDHGGGQVLKPDSTAFKILERFVKRANGEPLEPAAADKDDYKAPPFFEGLSMLTPTQWARRITLSLAGRLPTPAEIAAVEADGAKAIEKLLDDLMKEDTFFVRLREGFNDIFLTIGIEDNAETLLSYDQFENTRLWPQQEKFEELPEAERQPAGWKLFDVYRKSLLHEPLAMVEHIVRNERPFTEIVTADYIMVSPYSSKGYGVFDEVKDKFKDLKDPTEYVPVKLHALKGRAGDVQESATGFYPHAGYLGMFHWLRRYPTTDTNRNRLRARMFYQHFLGVDVMQLAPRVTDAAAVTAKYKVPTMEAADCVVCHKTIDPIAGLFQAFDNEGHHQPRKDGWYTDMFGPGYEGESMPPEERWRAPQWLGERAAKDPRFPIAMTEHVYYILMGRKVLQAPEDIDDPYYVARRRAYRAQRRLIEEVAAKLVESNFNLKTAFKLIAISKFYRADGHTTAELHPQRAAELDDMGLVRLVAPEQLNRKIEAIFGKPWTRLDDDLKILYGGIDSLTVTERNLEPSGAMGAIQRIVSNDVACEHVAREFHKPAAERRLFPEVELADLPGDPAADAKIRKTVVHLHRLLLGQELAPDHPEIERTIGLFVGLVTDAKEQTGLPQNENWFCGGANDFSTQDPTYTHRAWRGVVTYLMRQHEFLYE